MSVRDTYEGLKSRVMGLLKGDPDEAAPEAGKDDVKTAEWVQQLFDDGLKYEEDHFADTAHMRPTLSRKDNKLYAMSPREWRLACDKLKAGNLYDVIGHRNDKAKTAWRSENVEGLIPSNMSIRGSYISSNWHDITITPNINHADEIFNQERANKSVGWQEFVDDFREIAQSYGDATCRIQFYDDEEGGHVCVQVVTPGDFAITPNAKWIDEKLGGTYAAHGTMINNWQLKKYYPELVGEAKAAGALSALQKYAVKDVTKRGNYEHTKMYPRIELFIDDDTLIDRPFTEEEVEEIAVELEQMTMGVQVKARPEQNHKVHIEEATEAVQNFLSTVKEDEMAEEDFAFAQNVLSAFTQNIEEHTAMMDENDPFSIGLTLKYPHGRYICTVGGVLATDEPNPNVRADGYGVPWRKLFHRVYSKKMYGRNDGVGDPETLIQDEKKASIALSIFEDSVYTATPKRYRNIQDKLTKGTGAEQEDNDPLAVGYFVNTPPVSVAGHVAREALEMRSIAVEKAERAQGVNSISVGGEPKGQTSGFQTQLLQKQNERIITGDLDRNLRFTLEEVIEGMFEMYKVWYIAPRGYIIQGKPTPVNVSEMFSQVPKLQITIRPFSNYPNRFEIELSALVEIYGLRDEMGLPMIPSSAIKKHLATKYPQASNGEWDELTQATAIGLQVLAQQQAAQEEMVASQNQDKKTIDGVARSMERKIIQKELTGEPNGA